MCNEKNEEYVTAEEIMLTGEARRDSDIQKAKKWLNEQNIPKSGFNRSIQHKYYEFDDFIGFVQQACELYDLSTHFSMDEIHGIENRPKTMRNEADMMPTVYGLASVEIKSEHYHEPRVVKVPFCYMLVHQETGKAMTYARRYAYQAAFEISDKDIVEAKITGNNEHNYSKPRQWKNKKEPGSVKGEKVMEKQNKTVERSDVDDKKNNEDWLKNSIIKSLHTRMREKNPNARTDKKTTQKFAQIEYFAENISEEEFEEVKRVLSE